MKQLAGRAQRILGEGALDVLTESQHLESEGKRILHFEVGQPDFQTPSHIKETAKKAIDDNITRYVAPSGLSELKEAIQSEFETTRGYRPETNQVLVFPGAKPAIFLAMLAICERGEEVIYADPGFPTYGSLTGFVGAKAAAIPLRIENEFRLDPEDVAARINSNTKLIILNSPHNPTGSVMNESELQKIAELAEDYQCFILSDEIYSKIVYDGDLHSVSIHDEASEFSVVVDGFSKAYSMTGWRLGYLVGPSPLVEKLATLMTNAFTCTAPFIQKAGEAALRGQQSIIRSTLEEYREKRDTIVKGLNEIPGVTCLTPQGAFYAWPRIVDTGMSSGQLADRLLHTAGIACLPGTAFGEAGEGYLRFSYATSMDTIDEAIVKFKEFMEQTA
jgi:aspartate aminotransferase